MPRYYMHGSEIVDKTEEERIVELDSVKLFLATRFQAL